MTPKQRRFCDEYLIDFNATQAAIRAGYSANSAYSTGQRMLNYAEVKAYIDAETAKLHDQNIADATEVLKYLTKGMRHELNEEVIVVEGCGDGVSEAVTKDKQIGLKESIRCAELLGKRYGLFTDKVDMTTTVIPVIGGDDGLED